MNALRNLVEKKLKLQNNSVAFPESEWTEFSNEEIQRNLKIIRPDAVYHFNGQPLILFFDFTKQKNRNRENIIHRQVWCFDKAPVAFFIFDDQVQIYNAFRYQRKLDKLEKLDIPDYEQQFSFWNLQSGNTWQWLQDTFYDRNTKKHRVDQRLFDNIKKARKKLTEDIAPFLEDTFANTLILRLVFIRYLIDRNVKIDENFITGDTAADKKQHLNELIGDKVKLGRFFSHLEDRFNGNLFETEKDPEIAQKHLAELSQIFSAHERQLFLFDVFDFSIISVETISSIYESVIDPKKRKLNSAIYTPSFIVDHILSQTVDAYLEDKNECRILDPACGSGIFLVQAYRRMVEQNRDKEGKISDQRLVELIQQNLFGIDKDRNALNVTAFSLYVALLDYKHPPEIKRFKLPSLLNTNLFEADFLDEEATFNSEQVFENKQFDFILGNPPWGSKKYKEHFVYIKKHRIPIDRQQIAQTFLARTKDFANQHTQCALVVTSRAFYNLGAKKFKQYFLTRFHVHRIFDLSAVRRLIFPKNSSPAMVVFYRYAFGQSTEKNIIDHLSVKQNIFLKYFNTLVIERQDRKQILQKYFIEYDWMFKVALYGNTIDFHFLKRLSQYSIIDNQIDNTSKIFKGRGIPKKRIPESKPFAFLEGLPIIESDKIAPFHTVIDNNTPILKKEETRLDRGRFPELFHGNHILLKKMPKNESRLVVSYADTTCVFRNSAYSITSADCIRELKKIYGMLISDLSTYFQYITSSSWGVSTRPEILLPEYVSFPYGNIQDEDQFIALVDEFIESVRSAPHYSKQLLQKINQVIIDSYRVSELERDLIDYVLDVSRYQFQENKLQKLIRSPSPEELNRYAEVFYDHFGDIYNKGPEYFQIDIYYLPYFVAMTFKIVTTPPTPDKKIIFKKDSTEKDFFQIVAQSFSIHQESDKIFIQKDVKGFEEDFFYIIKPREYKCWHRAVAHYDLAEFVEAIEKAELKELTEAINE